MPLIVPLPPDPDEIEQRQRDREAKAEQVRLEERLQKRQLHKPKESEFQRVRRIMGR